MSEVFIRVYGVPAPVGSKTVGHTKDGRTFVRDASKRSAPWKKDIKYEAAQAMKEANLSILTGPLHVEVRFFMPRPKGHYGKKGLLPSAPELPTVRPDATKLWRPVEDALTGIVYTDDSQITHQEVWKNYGDPARVEIWIEDA